ncbi:hypothetical protein [Marinoscillum sp.]|uniref:hypothetical protein n=1 Tax=Marinoscillum sp. TaxID=2024838 RepID=UPI003BA8CB71
MITIIYPKDDFDAANVAVKVQALAQSRNQKLYVVPKHFGRNEISVEQNLKKSSVILLIAQSASAFDEQTLSELRLLQNLNKKIVGFIPVDLGLPQEIERNITLKRYHKGDSTALRKEIVTYLTEVQAKQDAGGFLIVLGLILFLFLLAFNNSDE